MYQIIGRLELKVHVQVNKFSKGERAGEEKKLKTNGSQERDGSKRQFASSMIFPCSFVIDCYSVSKAVDASFACKRKKLFTGVNEGRCNSKFNFFPQKAAKLLHLRLSFAFPRASCD